GMTDDQTMAVGEMVLGGAINKELVRVIQGRGGRAVGLTGKDGGLAVAERLTSVGGVDPGLVGDVVAVDATVLERLTGDFIPVLAPIAQTPHRQTLNLHAHPAS